MRAGFVKGNCLKGKYKEFFKKCTICFYFLSLNDYAYYESLGYSRMGWGFIMYSFDSNVLVHRWSWWC